MKAGMWEPSTNEGGRAAAGNAVKVKSGAAVVSFRRNPEPEGAPWTAR